MVTRKRLTSFVFFISLFLLIMSGCQKSSINGDLDGRWQLMEIEKDNITLNVKEQQLYYNFYLHVCNLSYYGGVSTEGNLFYKNNMIQMDFPYIFDTEEGIRLLANFGIYSNPVEFEVVFLNKQKLILKEGDNIIITLRKF